LDAWKQLQNPVGISRRFSANFSGADQGAVPRQISRAAPVLWEGRSVFSGKVDLSILPGDTVDVRADLDPTYVDDCQTLEKVPLENYDLVLCDPPYTGEDAERYGATMVRRKKSPEGVGTVSGRRPRRLAGSGFADVAPGLFRAGGGHWNLEKHEPQVPGAVDFSQAVGTIVSLNVILCPALSIYT
jgi:hypothetical protein